MSRRSGACLRSCLVVFAIVSALAVCGPAIYWRFKKGISLANTKNSCPPCICDCPPPLSLLKVAPGIIPSLPLSVSLSPFQVLLLLFFGFFKFRILLDYMFIGMKLNGAHFINSRDLLSCFLFPSLLTCISCSSCRCNIWVLLLVFCTFSVCMHVHQFFLRVLRWSCCNLLADLICIVKNQ